MMEKIYGTLERGGVVITEHMRPRVQLLVVDELLKLQQAKLVAELGKRKRVARV